MPGVEAIVVLDKTPFYAEMGGQVADHGVIAESDGAAFHRHRRAEEQGRQVYALRQADRGHSEAGRHRHRPIDAQRRKAIMRAHTATHLLDKALRTVLGDHVHQAGSLVEPDRLRFDFTHFSAMTAEELAEVNRHGQRGHAGGLSTSTPRCCPSRRPRRRAPSPCSARSTATPSGWWTWARATPWSSAAAPTWTTPPRWACSTSAASSPWPPACAASRPPPGRRPWR